jgi:C-terminal processing protease CtpA/Prc
MTIDKPPFYSKIFPGMPADQTRALFVGDVVLAVNGESMVNARHDEAVKALKQAGKVVNLQGKLLEKKAGIYSPRDVICIVKFRVKLSL